MTLKRPRPILHLSGGSPCVGAWGQRARRRRALRTLMNAERRPKSRIFFIIQLHIAQNFLRAFGAASPHLPVRIERRANRQLATKPTNRSGCVLTAETRM